jgi:hypothetical protein
MLHKKIITSFLVFAVLALALPVSAQNGGVGRSASTTERREEIKNNIEVRKASNAENRIEMQRGLAKRKAEHTVRVLSATVNRLGNIITRLESRIAKVDLAGGTTTQAKIFVAEAREHLALASSSIDTLIDLTLSDGTAQENFERIREIAREVKGHLREAHRSLMNAVRNLKGASSGVQN